MNRADRALKASFREAVRWPVAADKRQSVYDLPEPQLRPHDLHVAQHLFFSVAAVVGCEVKCGWGCCILDRVDDKDDVKSPDRW